MTSVKNKMIILYETFHLKIYFSLKIKKLNQSLTPNYNFFSAFQFAKHFFFFGSESCMQAQAQLFALLYPHINLF